MEKYIIVSDYKWKRRSEGSEGIEEAVRCNPHNTITIEDCVKLCDDEYWVIASVIE